MGNMADVISYLRFVVTFNVNLVLFIPIKNAFVELLENNNTWLCISYQAM